LSEGWVCHGDSRSQNAADDQANGDHSAFRTEDAEASDDVSHKTRASDNLPITCAITPAWQAAVTSSEPYGGRTQQRLPTPVWAQLELHRRLHVGIGLVHQYMSRTGNWARHPGGGMRGVPF
jgi:hypothetical protein